MSFTAEEIAAIAAKQGCTVAELGHRWVIMIAGAYYIHGCNGYLPPIGESDLRVSIRRDLAAVPRKRESEAGIDWDMPWGAGEKPKPMPMLLDEIATVARRLVVSMSISRSYYDPITQTFHERVCPLRQQLQPEYDPHVDEWLRLFGGDKHDRLLDWIATVDTLGRPTSGVYLHGSTKCGKTLFATGLSRLWSDAPTPLASVLSPFNSALLDCPLVFADEELPPHTSSGTIRALVGATKHSLRRKFSKESMVDGCIRLIIAANNPDLLSFDKENFTVEDIEAVDGRFLYIRCDPDAAEYLKSLGGYKGTSDWVSGDRIAKHALWLRENRKVRTGTRFLVEGEAGAISAKLATGGTVRRQVAEALVRAILTRSWPRSRGEYEGLRVGHGEVYANATWLREQWSQLISGSDRTPATDAVAKALAGMATGKRKFPITVRSPAIVPADGRVPPVRRLEFHRIDIAHVYRIADALQIATAEDLQERINGPWSWLTPGEEDGCAPDTVLHEDALAEELGEIIALAKPSEG